MEFICVMPEWEIMQGKEGSKPRKCLELNFIRKNMLQNYFIHESRELDHWLKIAGKSVNFWARHRGAFKSSRETPSDTEISCIKHKKVPHHNDDFDN